MTDIGIFGFDLHTFVRSRMLLLGCISLRTKGCCPQIMGVGGGVETMLQTVALICSEGFDDAEEGVHAL